MALVPGQGVEQPPNGRISGQSAEEFAPFPSLSVIDELFCSLQVKMGVEVPRVEVAASINRSLVGHLHNPGAKRRLVGIKDRDLPMHKQENILQEIVRLRSVAQNAQRNSSYQSRITAKQDRQRIPVLVDDTSRQAFV